MCWGWVGAAAQQVAGVGVNALASKYETQAKRDVLKYQIADLQNRRTLAEFRAQDALRMGRRQSSAQRAFTRGMVGEQRTSFAGAGVLVDSGTAGGVVAETEELGGIDALTIEYNAEKVAWGHQMEATQLLGEEQLARTQRANLRWARDFGIGASFLGAGTSFGSSMYNWYSQPTADELASRRT